MSGLMYAQMGMSVVSTVSKYSADRHGSKMREIQKKYHNKMVAISRANELNTLTENEIATDDAFKRAQFAIASSALHDQANAELNAAAAGVRGRAVEATTRGLARSRLTADWTLQRKAKAQRMVENEQFRSINSAARRSMDTAVIPRPSVAAAVTGLAANLLDVYDRNAAPGRSSTDTLSRLGR